MRLTNTQYHLKWVQRIREPVLRFYGNGQLACIRCGFSDSRALILDHIEGNGRQDLRRRKIAGGHVLYGQLLREGFPPGYQTLCWNCNVIKAFERKEFETASSNVYKVRT